MVRKKASGALLSARKHAIIKDMQAAIAREMAAQSEVPKSMPTRIAELVRDMSDFPHPALGQDFTPSPTARRAQAGTGVRA